MTPLEAGEGATEPGWPPPLGPLLRAVLRRPSLWWSGVAALARLGAPGWWHRWPPVPRPPDDYWRFRMETAYGSDPGRTLSGKDLIEYLRWCRRMPG